LQAGRDTRYSAYCLWIVSPHSHWAGTSPGGVQLYIKPEILRREMIASSVKYLLFKLNVASAQLSAPALPENEIVMSSASASLGSLGVRRHSRAPLFAHVAGHSPEFTSLEVDAMQLKHDR